MGEKTGISWTDHTFNPWWGCVEVSPGCAHCYAKTFSERLGMKLWGPSTPRRFFGDKHWNDPIKWNKAAELAGKPARVFCASMADVFEAHPSLGPHRVRLWKTIAETPWLQWQLLTKRPENWRAFVPLAWHERWPDNVWALVTAEDQERADIRIPWLMGIPASVRGVSYEPAIGPVDFTRIRVPDSDKTMNACARVSIFAPHVNWIIVGGESAKPASTARVFDIAWARAVLEQAKGTVSRVFIKQLGSNPTNSAQEDGDLVKAYLSGKADDPSEWPEDLRVQEFPA